MNTSDQRTMVGAQCPLCSADVYVYAGAAPREHTVPAPLPREATRVWVACPYASDGRVLDSRGWLVQYGGEVRIDLEEMEA